MKDYWMFMVGLFLLMFLGGAMFERYHPLRNEEKLPCCNLSPVRTWTNVIDWKVDVIRKGHDDADVKLDAIAVGIADLVNRKQPAPVVVEKVVTVEKVVDRIVEKPVTVITERVVHRTDPAAIEAMREARRYIAQWTFVDDPEENKIRAAALKKLAKALEEAK